LILLLIFVVRTSPSDCLEDRLRNNLQCVEWDIKPDAHSHSLAHTEATNDPAEKHCCYQTCTKKPNRLKPSRNDATDQPQLTYQPGLAVCKIDIQGEAAVL